MGVTIADDFTGSRTRLRVVEEWHMQEPPEDPWADDPQHDQQAPPRTNRGGASGQRNEGRDGAVEESDRKVVLTRASAIKPRRVRWLWDGRLALGTLGLLAGREGLGKSTLAYWIAGQVTLGQLEGEYHGKPSAVLVCASEDSWEHTIVPRLMAAGADLDRVYRIEVVTSAGIHGELSLPRDLDALEDSAKETGAALLLLDPLVSRLSSSLDSHKDAEVRLALEPLVAIADRAKLAVLGLIHHNKSGSTDPLQLVMGSKAFTAVARSVHTVIPDPDDDTETRRLFGTPKNNLGRDDLPALAFSIVGHPIETDDGTAWTGAVDWAGEVSGSIRDAMSRSQEGEDRSATSEAAEWLDDYLTVNGGSAASVDIKNHGAKAGHSLDCLKRARKKIKAGVESSGFPRKTYWMLQSEHQSEQISRGDTPTALTAPTGARTPQSAQLAQSEHATRDGAPTGAPTGGHPLLPTHGVGV